MPHSSAGLPTFVEAEEASKLSPGGSVCLKKSAKKTVVLLKINIVKSSSQYVADS